MRPTVIALVFGVLAACAVYGLHRGLVTGVAGDGMYQFDRDESPLGYALMIAGKLTVLVFCLAEILHAMNLCDDPMALLRPLFG
jgi:hypothetical protein